MARRCADARGRLHSNLRGPTRLRGKRQTAVHTRSRAVLEGCNGAGYGANDGALVSRFSLAGHDRGGRVAYRMALDHPDRIARLAVLDIIPTGEVFERADMRLALGYWPWSLLAQPEPLPERMITASADAVVDNALTAWGSNGNSFPLDVRSAYVGALRDPATVHAICEEYRAAATQTLRRT